MAEYSESDLTFTNQALTDINQDGVIDAADIIIDRGTQDHDTRQFDLANRYQ